MHSPPGQPSNISDSHITPSPQEAIHSTSFKFNANVESSAAEEGQKQHEAIEKGESHQKQLNETISTRSEAVADASASFTKPPTELRTVISPQGQPSRFHVNTSQVTSVNNAATITSVPLLAGAVRLTLAIVEAVRVSA